MSDIFREWSNVIESEGTLPVISQYSFEGGQKPDDHQAGQDRLEKIFIVRGFQTKQEDPVWLIDDFGDLRQYQVDVMIMTQKSYNLVALEVDKYGPKQGKAKSIKVMSNRDKLISQNFKIPIVRFDIDCLKEGRKKTKYYMDDEEIFKYVMDECLKWYKLHAIYVQESTGALINI